MISALLGMLSAGGVVALVSQEKWLESVVGTGFVRAAYWFACGAWIRTPWAGVGEVDPVPTPRPLTHAQLRRYLLVAGFAAIALVVALGLQAINGRWVD